jgi:hypothetical protein
MNQGLGDDDHDAHDGNRRRPGEVCSGSFKGAMDYSRTRILSKDHIVKSPRALFLVSASQGPNARTFIPPVKARGSSVPSRTFTLTTSPVPHQAFGLTAASRR